MGACTSAICSLEDGALLHGIVIELFVFTGEAGLCDRVMVE